MIVNFFLDLIIFLFAFLLVNFPVNLDLGILDSVIASLSDIVAFILFFFDGTLFTFFISNIFAWWSINIVWHVILTIIKLIRGAG